MSMLSGIGVSRGFATGPAVVVSPPPAFDPAEPVATDQPAASARVRAVLHDVADGLRARAETAPDNARPVLEAGAMIAGDPALADTIEALLATMGPTRAVHEAAGQYAALLESLGGYMAERVTDLMDVRDRAIARLSGVPEPGVPTLTEPSILVARDLAPAETALLDASLCLALVTEAGGPTSHTAILAAQLGIPAVVQVHGLAVTPGTLLAVDGGSGQVIIDPSPEVRTGFAAKQARRATMLGDSRAPGATKDGHPVALLANIGTLADAETAAAQAVEGVGLFRTEFLFLDRADAPAVAEQTATYTAVLRAFAPRHVVVRTLDAGADKPLAFADLGAEANPALGRRGLRLGRARTDLLDDQLDALAAAYAATGADLWVMAPMVATAAEAAWFAERVRARGLPRAGVMIEVPAAALRSRQVLQAVDFASLGTNDLGQYTMAADRLQGELADLLDPWQPAVLDVIAAACAGATALGKPVGVCGEAGGDPGLALVLAGLGVTSLSMATPKVRAVRTVLAAHTLAQCQEMAAAARAATGPAEARAAVLALADPVLTELL
ncbi:MAG: phosphoenolpyruvate--protein phosphotransferase [Propionibacteriaceae bacterium]|nr:phosphoenolpyruvate--protein phosphotransferase [Propionibacteriaceae bacterium]